MSEVLDLAVVNTQNAVQIFTMGGLSSVLDGIENKVRSMELDASTVAGRDEIRSVAYKVARTKTALDAEAKKLTEGWRTSTAQVNAERKVSQERLDALADEVRAPLTAFENKEKARIAGHEAALADLAMFGRAEGLAAIQLQQALDGLPRVHAGRDWEEFTQRADKERARRAESLASRLAVRRKLDADQAELARLRTEAEERQAREREEKIKADAAEKARAEAERKAKEAADAEARRVIEAARTEEARVKVESERVRLEHERAQRESEASRLREEQARVEAERKAVEAEAARVEAIRRADADRKAAEEKAAKDLRAAQEKAKADSEAAITRERARVAALEQAEAEEKAKREADEKLKAKVRSEISHDLHQCDGDGSSLWDEGESPIVASVVDAIMAGKVRHVRVAY